MTNKPHDVTAQAVVQFTRILFGVLSEKNGGDTTLNELRVMNQIILCHIKGRCCSVTALHKVTGISTLAQTSLDYISSFESDSILHREYIQIVFSKSIEDAFFCFNDAPWTSRVSVDAPRSFFMR